MLDWMLVRLVPKHSKKISKPPYIFLRHLVVLGKMADVLHFVVGIFGNAFALFLFLARLITFKRIVRNRSTEQFSGVPYVMTLLNCLLSAWYGMSFVSPNNLLVSTISGTGAVIETVYVLVFLLFAPGKEKSKIHGLFILVLSLFATVILVSLLALHGNSRKLFCGRLVIKTNSVEFMPFFLSLCGTSWFIFGLLGKDPFLALILYAIYRNNKGKGEGEGEEKATEMEMEKQGSKTTDQQKQSDGGQPPQNKCSVDDHLHSSQL